MQERPQNHPIHGWDARVFTHQLLGLGLGLVLRVTFHHFCPAHPQGKWPCGFGQRPPEHRETYLSASGNLSKITEESQKKGDNSGSTC